MRYFIMIAPLLLAGCGTMAGFGQDMQHAGANLENRATLSQRPPPPPPPPREVMAYPDPDQI